MPRASKSGVRGLFRDPDGRYRIDLRWTESATGEDKRYQERLPVGLPAATAKRRAQEVLSGALAGTFDPKRVPAKRLRVAFDEYLVWAKTNRPRTERDRRYHAGDLVESLGDVLLTDLAAFHVERFKRDEREAERAPATVNRKLATLKHMIGLASEWGWISHEHAASIRRVRLLREPPGRVRYLAGDEEERLFNALPERLRPVVVTAILSGMRLSEIRTLRRSQVDLAGRTITLTHTKTNRARRVPINDALAVVLDAAMKAHTAEHVFLSTRKTMFADKGRGLSHAFAAAVERAGIEDFHFHDLRHDFATRLRRKQVGIDAIAKLLGHTTLTMATRYAHLDDPTLRDAVRGLALGSAPVPEMRAVKPNT